VDQILDAAECADRNLTDSATGVRPDCRLFSLRHLPEFKAIPHDITQQRFPRFRLMIKPRLNSAAVAQACDESLIAGITNRQDQALTELFVRYGQRLKSVIGTVVQEDGEVDDVLQEIMIQIWHSAVRYSPEAGKPLSWLMTIARRRAVDRLRRRQAYCRAKERFEKQLPQHLNGVHHRYVDEEVTRTDLRRFLEEKLQLLPPFQSEAIRLSFFNGLTHCEIAAATRAPLGTVKTRLELGLQKLTQAMRPFRHKI
jgi:RNA polymerase sigma-70 factor (ECF subfamily)